MKDQNSREVEMANRESMPSFPEEKTEGNGMEPNPEPELKNFNFVPAAVFFYMFANNVIKTPLTDLLMTRVCLQNYSTEICDNMKNETDIENEVQVKTTLILLYSSMIQTIPSAFLSIFVGPWSDKYGHKIPVFVSVVGSMLYDAGVIVYGAYPHAPVYVLWLSSIPTGLTGAAVTFLGCSYSLAADSTDFRIRTKKFAFIQIAMSAGAPIGGLIGGLLYKSQRDLVFPLGLVGHLVTVFALLFVMKYEKVRKTASAREKVMDFFSLENTKESLRVVTKKRENNSRAQLLLIIASTAVIYLNLNSIGDVSFPFCKKMYNWDVKTYNLVNTISTVTSIVVLTIAIPVLLKVLKMTDSWLGLIGIGSYMADNAIKAFSYQPWMYYVSLAVGLLVGIAPFAASARLSKSARDDELGCVFSVASALQNLSPIIGYPLFTTVYNASIKTFPGAVFLVAATTLSFPFIVFIWLTRRPNNAYKETINEETNEEGR